MIVLDTSALAKLVARERESSALREILGDEMSRGESLAISAIAVTELRRLVIRLALPPESADPALSLVDVLKFRDGTFALAGRFPERHLRTLDAIHLASAVIAGADTMITYDRQLAEACMIEGLRVLSPGSA